MPYDANLRQLPLFANMPSQHLEWTKEAMRTLRFDAGETIFRQGDESQGLYMFLNGRGRLTRTTGDGNQQILAEIGANQYLNEAALFKPNVESATLQVIDTSHVLFISRQKLREVVGFHPEMKRYLPIEDDATRIQRKEKLFLGQRDNEEVLLATRRHWWAFGRNALIPFILAVAMVLVAVMMPDPALMIVVFGLAVILPGALTVYLYLEWRNDEVIITSQRIIRIERTILTVQEHRSEIPLGSVQQINVENVTSDLLSRVFDYGTVNIRTSGQSGTLTLDRIPNPEGLQELIFENRSKQQTERDQESQHVIRAEVDRVLHGRPAVARTDNTDPAQPYIAVPPRGFLPTHFTDEDGDTVYRKHVLYWMRKTFTPTLIIIIGIIMLFFAGQVGPLGYALNMVIFLVGIFWFWWADWDWRHDYYVIGDEMLQIVHKRPFFMQDEDDQVLLERVDNVISRREGVFQTLFDYGIVKISLVGTDKGEEKRLNFVPNPTAVQEEITRRQQRWRRRQESANERRRRDEIAEYLTVYHNTVQGQGGAPQGNIQFPNQAPSQQASPSTHRPQRVLPSNLDQDF
jgi:membrane protein YdbS with pleckstrin-like domain